MEDGSGFEDRAYEEELKNSLNRFNEMESSDKEYFFDINQFEALFDYFLERGEWEISDKILRMANKQHPKSNSINIREAHLNLALGKVNSALSILNKAEKLEPYSVDIILLKAQAYSQIHMPKKAIQYFEMALKSSVENKSEIMLDIAMEYEEIVEFGKAIEILKKLLKEEPNNEIALHEISHCYELENKTLGGIDFFKRFLDENPFSASGWFILGEMYMRVENNKEAVESFDYAIAIDEEYAHAYFNKGIVFANKSDFISALKCFLSCAEYEGMNPLTTCYIGECYEKTGEFEYALEYYNKVLELDDRWSDAWMGKAVVYNLMDKPKIAIKMIKNAIKSIPDNYEYLVFEAVLHGKIGDFENAINGFEKSINILPDNDKAWLEYADFMYNYKGSSSALEIMREGLIFNEENVEFNYRMVAYLLQEGKESEALMFLEEALDLDYDEHYLLLDYFPEAINNQNINQLLEIYKT